MAAEAEDLGYTTPPELELLHHPILEKLALFDPEHRIDIKVVREGGLVDCFIPFDLIDDEEVPIDENYARDLADQFAQEAEEAGGTGQHSATTLGLIDGESKLKISDGFHRTAALKIRGEDTLYATVKLTDWDGLYRNRILQAKDNAHVRFSRVVQWMREAWSLSELSKLMVRTPGGGLEPFTIEQAASLFGQKGSGTGLGLSTDEVTAAKAWIARKEQQWQVAAMTIHADLKVAEHVDPALVHATRPKTSSNSLEAPTQSILKVFSEELPDRFELQQVVMKTAMGHNLQAPGVRALSQHVSDCISARAAQLRIAKIDWDTWQPEYSKRQQRDHRLAHHPGHKGATVLDKAMHEIRSTTERTDLAIERKEEITAEMRAKIIGARERAEALVTEVGGLIMKLYELLGEKPPLAVIRDRPASLATPISEAVAVEKIDEHEEPEADFDPSEDAFLVDEDATPAAAEVVEETPEIDDDEEAGSTVDWDEELFDDDEIDEDDEEIEELVYESRLHEADGSETLASRKFKDALRTYLNGKADDYPDITNRMQIQWAENMLVGGSFSGPHYLQDELRDELRQAEKKIRERTIPAKPKLRRDLQAKLDAETV